MQTKVQELFAKEKVTAVALIFTETYYHYFFRILRVEAMILRQHVSKAALDLTLVQELSTVTKIRTP